MTQHGVVIAGTHSGVGKTTIACGVMAALMRRKMQVQPFKVGPDYIDPAFHGRICGRPSINLDAWITSAGYVEESFRRNLQGADVAVVEGVMGLFDGSNDPNRPSSTADVATLLDLGVILVVDVSHMAGSAAAMVHGYVTFNPTVNIRGVIVNKVGSDAHYAMVRQAIEETGVPVLGGISREQLLAIPERHLGLTSVEEYQQFQQWLDKLADCIEESIDLERLLEVSTLTKSIIGGREQFNGGGSHKKVRIAVAWDPAFCFYYHDNLALLQQYGGEIVEFSPIKDQCLPSDIHGIYLGGGYPELFRQELAANTSMLQDIRWASDNHVPILAECGGLMYLCQDLAGIVPAHTRMNSKLTAMGYRAVELSEDTILGPRGTRLKGHEFHYSSIEFLEGNSEDGCTVFGALGQTIGKAGYATPNLFASYIHFHFGSNPQVAQNFIASAYQYKQSLLPS